MNQTTRQQTQQQAIRKTMVKAGIGLVLMFGFAFALVPLYEVICDLTGLNGNTSNLKEEASRIENIDEVIVDESREVRMQFVAIGNKHAPVEFSAVSDEASLNPGAIETFYYKVKNLSNRDLVIQAVPSVSPNEAASHVRKMECFCFTAQPLAAGTEAQLFVSLYVHESLPAEVHTLTLAYSLFDITDKVDYETLVAANSAGRGEPDPNVDYGQVVPHNDDGHDHTGNIAPEVLQEHEDNHDDHDHGDHNH